jgi:hypothetical protein
MLSTAYHESMYKSKIQNFVDTHHSGSYRFLKEKLFIKTFGQQAYTDLLNATNYLDVEDPVSLRVHCYMNDITSYPTCKMCSNRVKFNSTKGWLTYCSNDCRYSDYDYIQDKKRSTNMEKYGSTNVLASRYVLDQRKVNKPNNASVASIVEPQACYLTESNLELFIKTNITSTYIRDKKLEGANTSKRYDFILPDQNIIVEFDGSHHYTSSKVILGDDEKDKVAASLGYHVVRIPYFVQLDATMIQFFFCNVIKSSVQLFDFNTYKHGFIDSRAVIPADYCELGQHKFLKNLQDYPKSCTNAIINSLTTHVNKHCTFSALAKFIDAL